MFGVDLCQVPMKELVASTSQNKESLLLHKLAIIEDEAGQII